MRIKKNMEQTHLQFIYFVCFAEMWVSGGGDVTGSTSVVKTSSLDDTVYVLEEGVAVTAANLSMPGKSARPFQRDS